MRIFAGYTDPFISPVTGILSTDQSLPDLERGFVWLGNENNRPVPSFKLIDMEIDLKGLTKRVTVLETDMADVKKVIEPLRSLPRATIQFGAEVAPINTILTRQGLPFLFNGLQIAGLAQAAITVEGEGENAHLVSISDGKIWRGTESGVPQAVDDLTRMEADVTFLNARLSLIEVVTLPTLVKGPQSATKGAVAIFTDETGKEIAPSLASVNEAGLLAAPSMTAQTSVTAASLFVRNEEESTTGFTAPVTSDGSTIILPPSSGTPTQVLGIWYEDPTENKIATFWMTLPEQTKRKREDEEEGEDPAFFGGGPPPPPGAPPPAFPVPILIPIPLPPGDPGAPSPNGIAIFLDSSGGRMSGTPNTINPDTGDTYITGGLTARGFHIQPSHNDLALSISLLAPDSLSSSWSIYLPPEPPATNRPQFLTTGAPEDPDQMVWADTTLVLEGDVTGSGNMGEVIETTFAPDPVFTGKAMTLPVGTTAERPEVPIAGMLRFNTDLR